MANSKRFVVKNGLETQNIQFVTADGTEKIIATVLEDGTLSFSGTSGQLFSIVDSLTGSIFSVNDISGIPSIEVFDDGKVILAESTGNVGIGTITPTEKLTVSGNVSATRIISTQATGTSPLAVTSTTKVDNLNADLLDGLDSTAFYLATNPSGYTTNTGTVTSVSAGTQISGMAMTITNGTTTPSIATSITNAANFRTAIGAGTGNGTVTAVTGTSPVASSGGTTPAISLASGYGDTQNPYASKTQKTFLAAPNAADGVPTFRTIIASDVPTLNQNTTGTSAGVVRTVTGTTSAELVRGNMADNDQARILVGGTATNAGFLEIATADDGTEPIHVRQYTGVFSTLTRTATLLDGSGNTSFPGKLGIGTTTPLEKLSVEGDVYVKDRLRIGIDDLTHNSIYLDNSVGSPDGRNGLYSNNGDQSIAVFDGSNNSWHYANSNLIYTESTDTLQLDGNLTVNGNIINTGSTVTVNTSNLTVTDKNIEIGFVTPKSGLVATLATGTVNITLTTGTTEGMIPGQALTKTSGTGVFGTNARIATITSLTTLTATVNHATAGSITFTASGATDFTADGGGITLKGTTDKTITWNNATSGWESNQNITTTGVFNKSTVDSVVITQNNNSILSTFKHPTGNTAIPIGSNTFVGLAGNTTMGSTATSIIHASFNTAVGSATFNSNTIGSNNTAVGRNTLNLNNTGNSNTSLGAQNLLSNTSGSGNNAVGHNSLRGNTTGSNNNAIGVESGWYIADGTTANATGSNSLFLGNNTKALAAAQTNQIVIGHNATGLGSNTVVLGNTDIVTTALSGNVGIGTTTPGEKLDVLGNARIQGNILLDGTPTTTNQARTISFTGFDKELTTDFSDAAFIRHTVNIGGHAGSVLELSSQNDAADGIALTTNASSQIRHNGHIMWDANNDGAASGLDADLLDGNHASAFYLATNPSGYTTNTGTVTSVGITAGTGISVSGSPITGSGSITVTNSSPNATHSGDVTGSGALTIANNAVNFAKMQDIDTARILGRVTASAGDPEALTATQVRTLLNVADGATANTGTVTGVTATAPIASSGGTAPVISHNNSGVTAGTYNNVTVNVTGHVTAGSNVSYLTAHPTIATTSDTTNTAAPGYSGTFTAIDSVTRDGNGHVTTLNTKTVTMPAAQSIPTVNDGTLSWATNTAGSTNTTISPSLSGAYSANTANNRTLSLAVGPALTNLSSTMTGATPVGFLKKTGADTYSIDTNTYLTSFTEADTLASVTGRGNTTTTDISIANLILNNAANRTISTPAVTGTNSAGRTLTVSSGPGTGTGAVSTIAFQTPTVGTTGTTTQSMATRLLLNSTGAAVTGALSSTGSLTVGTTSSLGGDVTFTNAADRTLSIAPSASGTVGRSLVISAGSTTAGTANRSGGSLFINSGDSTGSGSSLIRLNVPSVGVSGNTGLIQGNNSLTLDNNGLEIFTTLPSGLDGTTYTFRHGGFDLLSYEQQTTDHSQFRIDNYVSSSTNSITKTSLYIESSGTWDGTDAVNRGLYVNAVDGTNNYAAIFDGGNVGIGTIAPAVKLDVVGQVAISTETYPSLSVETTSTQTNLQASSAVFSTVTSGNMADGFGSGIQFAIEDDANVINPIAFVGAVRSGADNSGSLTFSTSNAGTSTRKITILPDGNVGIGTATPSAKLDVVGDVKHTGLTMTSGTNVDQLKETTFTSALTTAWTDVTGVSGTYLATGSHIVQIISNGEYYTGTLSWFSGTTTSTVVDEIVLHRAGPAASAGRIFARVIRTSSAPSTLKLQVSGSASISSHTMTFKFRRTI